jgi:hypothetical protein
VGGVGKPEVMGDGRCVSRLRGRVMDVEVCDAG